MARILSVELGGRSWERCGLPFSGSPANQRSPAPEAPRPSRYGTRSPRRGPYPLLWGPVAAWACFRAQWCRFGPHTLERKAPSEDALEEPRRTAGRPTCKPQGAAAGGFRGRVSRPAQWMLGAGSEQALKRPMKRPGFLGSDASNVTATKGITTLTEQEEGGGRHVH